MKLLAAFTVSAVSLLAVLAVTSPAKADHDDWLSLFDGRTLMGWQSNPENPTSFSIEEGAIKVSGNISHMFYVGVVNDAKFKDIYVKPL